MSSSTSLPTRSASRWAGPPLLCCSHNTQTSSAITHGRISSLSSLEDPVRTLVSLCLSVSDFFFLILHLHDFCILAVTSSQTGPWFISRDWRGIRPVIDAAIVGRVYTTPKPTSPPTAKKWKSRRKRPSKRRGQRRRQSRHDDFWFYDLFDLGDYSDSSEESIMQEYQSTPIQNVYFFKKGKSAWKKMSQNPSKNSSLFFLNTFWFVCFLFVFNIR